MTEQSMLPRAMGILVFDEGVIIRAYPVSDERTDIELAPSTRVGAIVRDLGTGLWRYDEELRTALGIREDPRFDTDYEAGNALEDHLLPLHQVNLFARGLLSPRQEG